MSEQFPMFKPIPKDLHVIHEVPNLHILPKTETVMYALTWMIEQKIWIQVYDTCVIGKYTLSSSGAIETQYNMRRLLKAWYLCANKNTLTSPDDEMYFIKNQIGENFDVYSPYMVLASHLSPKAIASIISAVDTESAITDWTTTPIDNTLYLNEKYESEDYYEDYGLPCPYRLNHELNHFTGRTKRLLAVADAIQKQHQIDYQPESFFVHASY